MFVGHYGPAFALRKFTPDIPLWALFLAVQLMDVAWAVLVLLGIEKIELMPGLKPPRSFDLIFMPYTHGLLGSVGWAVVGFFVCGAVFKAGNVRKNAVLVASAAFSHWILDFVVHRPDLPLLGNQFKVGLGLWEPLILGILLECGVLVSGVWFYLRSIPKTSAKLRFRTLGLTAVMLVMQAMFFWGPQPTSDMGAAGMGLLSSVSLICLAVWTERGRDRFAV